MASGWPGEGHDHFLETHYSLEANLLSFVLDATLCGDALTCL
jgi:hypothetical protein